ncbi:MAG: D-alanyl-D-alanine carboxypeptidase [Clostridia bacterium]|nr:D-alanyl-D-alanine carboxypeptidase [Clostridia bacterium]
MFRKIVLLLVVCLVTSVVSPNVGLADDAIEQDLVPSAIFEEEPVAAIKKVPFVDATAAIVMDMKSGRVLFEKNSRSQKAIASTTKIMTAIVAIENGDLNDTVTVSKKAASIWGSTVGIKEGQEYKLRELLYGLMLNSGNDAAIAIAEHIGGSVEGFVGMMNEKAKALGAMNTSFKTPHGLDMDGHFSTAYDLALITRYALQNKTFCSIVGTKRAAIPGKELLNTNEMLGLYPGADGVKTGFTGQAGRCLVTSATRNNFKIISVVLGCPTRAKRAQSSKSILDYGFVNYKPYKLLAAGEEIGKIPVIKGIFENTPVYAADSIEMPLREDEKSSLQREVEWPDSLNAPVSEGQTVGRLKYTLEGKVIAESELKIATEVRKKGVLDYLGDIFIEWQRIMRLGI